MTSPEPILIHGGFLVDGTGSEPYLGDVLICDGRIKAVGTITPPTDARILDAEGCVVCPGFIDAHRHIDAALLRTTGYGEVELRQGITTALCGNCGFSLFPCDEAHQQELFDFLKPIMGDMSSLHAFSSLVDFLQAVRASSPAIHVGSMIGNGTVRMGLSGYGANIPSEAQMQESKSLIAKAMDEGAFGLSMGLMYAPENSYSTKALTRLAKAARGGVLATHIRGEGASLAESVGEVLQIASDAQVKLQISHFKAAGRVAWDNPFKTAMDLVEHAIAFGQDVSCDVYPYEAGSTSLLTLLPPKWLGDGIDALVNRLSSREVRKQLAALLSHEQPDWDNIVCSCGWDSIWIASATLPQNQWLIGQSVLKSTQESNKDVIDLVCDLIVSERGNVSILNFIVSQENLRTVLSWVPISYISDSVLPVGKPHPRYHGAFARILSEYVREQQLLPLEEAIHRMTLKPAIRYGIPERGILQIGAHADIAVFDPVAVTDRATYTKPTQMATGFRYVLVDGAIAIKNDQYTGYANGSILIHHK